MACFTPFRILLLSRLRLCSRTGNNTSYSRRCGASLSTAGMSRPPSMTSSRNGSATPSTLLVSHLPGPPQQPRVSLHHARVHRAHRTTALSDCATSGQSRSSRSVRSTSGMRPPDSAKTPAMAHAHLRYTEERTAPSSRAFKTAGSTARQLDARKTTVPCRRRPARRVPR